MCERVRVRDEGDFPVTSWAVEWQRYTETLLYVKAS